MNSHQEFILAACPLDYNFHFTFYTDLTFIRIHFIWRIRHAMMQVCRSVQKKNWIMFGRQSAIPLIVIKRTSIALSNTSSFLRCEQFLLNHYFTYENGSYHLHIYVLWHYYKIWPLSWWWKRIFHFWLPRK